MGVDDSSESNSTVSDNSCGPDYGQISIGEAFCHINRQGTPDTADDVKTDMWNAVVQPNGGIDERLCRLSPLVKRGEDFSVEDCQSALADYIEASREAREKKYEKRQLKSRIKRLEKRPQKSKEREKG